MRVTRHFAAVGARLVHYRMCGSGPPLLLVHQSPRSSLEYQRLMQDWGAQFTCIAPDTPGFGESDALPPGVPEVEDFADATVAFLDALGLDQVAAYGFHSGAIILVTAGKRHPERFSAIAANGYAVWTEAEKAAFADAYLPPFVPQPYGEHLAWVWRRIMEQSWVFPWYDVRPEARLTRPHADPEAVHAIAMEMLAAGDNYRRGYGAVLRANRDVPGAGAPTVPTYITSPDGDPLQAHIARLGLLPANWRAEPLPTLEAAERASLEHLMAHSPPAAYVRAENGARMGFVEVEGGGFSGQIHWRGPSAATRIRIPEPGLSARAVATDDALALDLPGHGLSDAWPDAPVRLGAWGEAIAAAVARLSGGREVQLLAGGLAVPLAEAAVRHPEVTAEVNADAAYRDLADTPGAYLWPDLTPEVSGSHLHRAWHWARTRRLFSPWCEVSNESALDFDPVELSPERLAVDHLAALQARAAPALFAALAASAGCRR